MKSLSIVTGLIALVVGGGCASLQSVSVTNIPRERGQPIEANADNPAFLGIHFSNDFADDLPEELRRQCPGGKVTGVYSKYESTWYFLVQNREVTVHGYCVPAEPKVTTAPASSPAAPVPATPPAPTFPNPPTDATSALELSR